MAAGGKSHLQVLKGVKREQPENLLEIAIMPKMHIWLNLNRANKNRLKSNRRSALHLTHVAIFQRVTEVLKNGMARAIRPPMHLQAWRWTVRACCNQNQTT
jgi:hypothetical protein